MSCIKTVPYTILTISSFDATITPDNYVCTGVIPNRPSRTINVVLTVGVEREYRIRLTAPQKQDILFTVTVTFIQNPMSTIGAITSGPGAIITPVRGLNGTYNQPGCTTTTPNTTLVSVDLQNEGFYLINLAFCQDGSDNVQVSFAESKPFRFNSNLATVVATNNVATKNVVTTLSPRSISETMCTGFQCSCFTAGNCGTIKAPIVSIIGQTTIDGSDVGDVIFTICDEFQYYKEVPIEHENKCQVIFLEPSQIMQTLFNQCCPFMVSVVKGVGDTLYEKAINIFDRHSEAIGLSFSDFYTNLILYGMAKYILSRILYGNFNINYLLGKYNDKFLRDLGGSRFCSLLPNFIDCEIPIFGYNKYFKFSKHGRK